LAVFGINGVTSWISKRFKLTDHDGMVIGSEDCGVRPVNAQAALTLSAVFACARLIARSIASLPCGIYEMDSQGDKVLVRDSDLYRILRRSPNADMTAFNFWVAVISSILLWGNAYVLKTYRTGKKIVSLEPLLPSHMSIRENKDGSFKYIYTDPIRGTQKEYNEDEIMHLKGFTLDGRIGLSVIAYANQSFGNSLAQEDSNSRTYQRGMQKTGVLKVEKSLTPEQRQAFKDNIAKQFSGLSKSGGTLVLEGGMSFEALSLTPADAELIASRSFSIEEICRWFGVPPVLIGHNDKTTSWGTGIEQINLGFLTYVIQPILVSIEQEIHKSLIEPADKERLFAEFNIEGFLRSDSAGRASLYSSASQNGWMTRQEIRKKENLPYVDGSDTLTVQSALVNLNQLDKIPRGTTSTTPDPANNGDKKTILDIKDLTIPHIEDPDKV